MTIGNPVDGQDSTARDKQNLDHITGETSGDGDEPILKVRNLTTRFFTDEGQVNAVEDVSFDVYGGEAFGIVGESGSGKSVTAMSILGIVESPGRITGGELWYRDADLAAEFEGRRPQIVNGEYVDMRRLSDRVRRSLRGSRFSMVFQDPMTSFDPAYTVGEQIAEAVEVQRRARANPRSVRSRTQGYGLVSFLSSPVLPSKRYISEESFDRAVELLEQVGIPDPEQRAKEYPHQFSGGMLQRGMIAQALAANPDILIADEPTSALDVTIQAQILRLLKELREETDMSIVLITHNMGVIARMCDRIGVMYAGEIVERGSLEQILDDPAHPYTQGLLNSIPNIDDPDLRLRPIDGNVPSLFDEEMGDRCYFADRCPRAMEVCLERPAETQVDGDAGHTTRCVLARTEYDAEKALPNGYFKEMNESDGNE